MLKYYISNHYELTQNTINQLNIDLEYVNSQRVQLNTLTLEITLSMVVLKYSFRLITISIN